MLRYKPPKSSVWGHRLRRMPIGRVHGLLQQFLETTADGCKWGDGNLWMSNADPDTVSRYEAAVGRATTQGYIQGLGYGECQRCLELLLADEQDFRANEVHLSLWRPIEIGQWKRRTSDLLKPSLLTVQYDVHAHLQTTLFFESPDQFQFVADALRNLGLCALNRRHLKMVSS
ncbi:MAG TPA: hypothetical protein VIN03_04025 [Roseateles sp.]